MGWRARGNTQFLVTKQRGAPDGAPLCFRVYLNFTAVPYAMTSAAPCITAAEA